MAFRDEWDSDGKELQGTTRKKRMKERANKAKESETEEASRNKSARKKEHDLAKTEPEGKGTTKGPSSHGPGEAEHGEDMRVKIWRSSCTLQHAVAPTGTASGLDTRINAESGARKHTTESSGGTPRAHQGTAVRVAQSEKLVFLTSNEYLQQHISWLQRLVDQLVLALPATNWKCDEEPLGWLRHARRPQVLPTESAPTQRAQHGWRPRWSEQGWSWQPKAWRSGWFGQASQEQRHWCGSQARRWAWKPKVSSAIGAASSRGGARGSSINGDGAAEGVGGVGGDLEGQRRR